MYCLYVGTCRTFSLRETIRVSYRHPSARNSFLLMSYTQISTSRALFVLDAFGFCEVVCSSAVVYAQAKCDLSQWLVFVRMLIAA